MRIRFHRSRPFEAILPDPRDIRRRGFFFHLALGVEAPVDPLSGMTVNLMTVDRWLDELPWSREAPSAWGLLDVFWPLLAARAREAGASLTRLEIRDETSWWATGDGKDRERGLQISAFRPVAGLRRPCRRELVLTATAMIPRDPPPEELKAFSEGDLDVTLAAAWPALKDWSLREIREAEMTGDRVKTYRHPGLS